MQQFLIFDDFYREPLDVRKFALSCSYDKSKHTPWPGLVSQTPWSGTREALEKIARLVSTESPDWQLIVDQHNFWGEGTCGQFRVMYDGQGLQPRPHAHFDGQWTGLIGLSLPHDVRGGTVFYRHRRTNTVSSQQLERGLYRDLIERDGGKDDAWEPIGKAETGFNRLVVFDSRQFHSFTSGFGHCLDNCRLMQIFDFTIPAH